MSNKLYASNEDAEQIAVMQWANFSSGRWPQLKLLHHIPNGGSRNAVEAAKLKRMGVRAGAPDLHLPVNRCGYHSIYIEMKYGKNKLQAEQINFLAAAASEDNYCIVCYSADDAIYAISSYLKDKKPYPNLSIIRDGKIIGTAGQ